MSNPHSITSNLEVQHKYHTSSVTNWVNRVAWVGLAVGIIALLGAVIGFMAFHGVLPHHIAAHLSFFSDHRFALLGAGLGLVAISALGKLYVRHREKNAAKDLERLDQDLANEYEGVNEGALRRAFIKCHAASLEDQPIGSFTVLQSGLSFTHSFTKNISYILPSGFYALLVKTYKGYMHHYEDPSNSFMDKFKTNKLHVVPIANITDFLPRHAFVAKRTH